MHTVSPNDGEVCAGRLGVTYGPESKVSPRVPEMHEKPIEIRWRDLDAFGHVNNAVYLTYLEEVRDEWLERALGGTGDLWDFVLARVAVDFRRELTQDHDQVVVRCRLAHVGRSSIRTLEQILTLGGETAAEAEAVLVARDRESGASRPLTPGERAALERIQA
jgi:acyl-CoA thioester hydrolase